MTIPLRYIKLARNAAKSSDVRSIKVGSCLIGDAIHVGWNTRKTHTLLPKLYGRLFSTHAEVRVLLAGKRDKNKKTLIVCREDALGNLKNARPCKGCLSFIILNDIKKIFYSIDNEKFGFIKNNGSLTEKIVTY